jgi:hypothetical protein
MPNCRGLLRPRKIALDIGTNNEQRVANERCQTAKSIYEMANCGINADKCPAFVRIIRCFLFQKTRWIARAVLVSDDGRYVPAITFIFHPANFPSTAEEFMSPRVLTALPVLNEEQHLVEVLDKVKQYAQDILVVNDGSSDRTGEVLTGIDGILVSTHEVNQGYGAALRTAFNYAIENDYDVVVTIDCDGQHEPSLIPKIAAEVYPDNGEPFDIISGSRYLKQFDADSIPPEDRRRVNVEITKRLNEMFGFGITDAFCGFKAYRTLPLEKLSVTELGYAMPLQLWVQAHRLEFRLKEFPVPLVYLDEERSFGGSLDDTEKRLTYYGQVLDQELATFGVADAVDEQCESAKTMCD